MKWLERMEREGRDVWKKEWKTDLPLFLSHNLIASRNQFPSSSPVTINVVGEDFQQNGVRADHLEVLLLHGNTSFEEQ